MDFRISAEDWKSTEMIRAENALFDAVDRAERVTAEVEQRMAELEADNKPKGMVEALTEYATGPTAPAELREAFERVRSGELTREQALADPRIAADPVAGPALEAAARTGPPEPVHGTPAPVAPRRPRPAPRAGYDDEEDFSTHTILRRS